MIRKPLAAVLFASLLLACSGARAEEVTFQVDKSHSSVNFRIRHLLSKVTGQFRSFGGTVVLDPVKRDTVKVEGTIDVASIDTGDAKRDEHLRNEDFFDVARHPKITFKADKLTDVNDDKTAGKLHGELTMHGVTRPIVIEVEWYGVATDPWGNSKAGFAGTTKLNRKDYGIEWNKSLDSGGLLIGEEVEIELQMEAAQSKT
ncbi:MAG TPA: YceI family protein [Candidatus Limnocylindrales bacterium]|nr:YceI family protein [Candidatus Limnocylindrales bacterium]